MHWAITIRGVCTFVSIVIRIDLQWRYKICLPFVASFPLLAVYAATGGSTWIGVPSPVAELIGRTSIDLG